MPTIPEYTVGHDRVIARLTTGRWQVSYPGYPTRTRVEEGATAKSYGLRWDTGCDLRVQGKAFTVDPFGIIDGYDKADGRHFVRYTPLPEHHDQDPGFWPNGQCVSCGLGLDTDERCVNSECRHFDRGVG